MKTAFVTGGSGFVGRALIRTLAARDVSVRALARSAAAIDTVRACGAIAVEGDLASDVTEAMKGSDVVFHAAASTEDWGDEKRAWEVTVTGTANMLRCARAAGVPRFVHVGTEAALVDGSPIVRANEERPLPARPIGIYPRTKAAAERKVRAANGDDLATIVVRPRFIWGKDDTTLLPRLIEAAQSGALHWIDGGHYLTSTCHIDNVCEGLLKAAEKGVPGEAYFITDGEPIEFRKMISAMLESKGVKPPEKSIPRWIAKSFAWTTDALYRTLRIKKRPPVPYASFLLIGQEVTVDDTKARRDLGYEGRVTIEEGLAAMRDHP
jgi:nucleoside-diphosphate-sugar epimerase